jgi:thiamine pyrophosphate-dependent acetolactate synthase large subunit-like protein
VTKWFRLLESVDGIEDHLDQTFIAAASGKPGPAVLMLPLDLQTAAAGARARRTVQLGHWPLDRPRACAAVIEQAAALIAAAHAPIVIAGGGVHGSQASDALVRIERADQLDAALAEAAGSGRLTLLDVITDPGAHPPLSLYDGKLDRMSDHGVVQEAVI